MTITYPLTPPATAGFGGIRLKPQATVGSSRSPFTYEGQFYVHQGQIWQAELSLPPLTRADGEAWVAFLLSLNGMQGTFLMGIEGNETPRGAATGAPLVKGASQTGQSLITDGWTAGVTGILKAGDFLQLGSGLDTHLHKVLADANSNGAGEATFDIWPRLRVSPIDNDTVTVVSAKGLWRLATNEMPYELGNPMIYGIGFPIIEAI